MNRIIPILCVFIFTSACDLKSTSKIESDKSKSFETSAKENLNCTDVFSGKKFTYLYDKEIPEHLFTVKFICVKGQHKGILFGPAPEGDHGLYYFKATLENLSIVDNMVSFSFTQGDYYTEQITLENYEDVDSWASYGSSHYTIKMEGELIADQIEFTCTSEFNNCYDSKMKFELLK